MKTPFRAGKSPERRGSARKRLLLREGSLLEGRPERLLRCTIKDISEGGARVRLQSRQEVAGDEVTLIDPTEGTERKARVVWQAKGEIGLAFVGEPRLGRPRGVEPP